MAAKFPELPEDVIKDEILPRLTAESVVRCRCVSKPWRLFLSSPEFVKAHLERHLDDSESALLKAYSDYSFHAATDIPFRKPGLLLHAGSCHGLVLFSRICQSDPNMILVNPITLEAREIPNQPTVRFANWGFGYDSFRDDYKIVGFDKHDRVHIYSLKTETWTFVANSPYGYCYHEELSGMSVNGRIHWPAYKPNSNREIAAFNLASEEFEQVPFPVEVLRLSNWRITVVDGCLAIAVDGYRTFDLWVMKEYGDSWVKFVIHNVVPMEMHSFDVISLVGEDEILVKHQGKLSIHNLRNRDWKDFAVLSNITARKFIVVKKHMI